MTTQPLKGIIKEEPKNGLLDLLIFTLQMILLLTMIVPWIYIGQKLDFFFQLRLCGTKSFFKLGSVAGPLIQANGRLSFKDDLRSGGLLYCVSQ
jgi:hypothetical protein